MQWLCFAFVEPVFCIRIVFSQFSISYAAEASKLAFAKTQKGRRSTYRISLIAHIKKNQSHNLVNQHVIGVVKKCIYCFVCINCLLMVGMASDNNRSGSGIRGKGKYKQSGVTMLTKLSMNADRSYTGAAVKISAIDGPTVFFKYRY